MSAPDSAKIDKPINIKKILTLLLKLGLGAIAIYIIVQKVDLREVGRQIAAAHWGFLGLSFLAFFSSKVIAAFRLNTFYRTQGVELSEITNLKINFLGMFYNLFVPLVGGEAYKIYWIQKRHEVPVKQLIWASVLDRVSGLAALVSLAIVFFYFSSYTFPYKSLILLLIPLMYGVYFLMSRWLYPSFQAAWQKANLYSLAVQSLQVACTFCILLALNIPEQYTEYLFVFLVSCLAYVLPFIGAREMAFVFGAEYLGLDTEISLTISLLFYMALACTSLIGLYFTFKKPEA